MKVEIDKQAKLMCHWCTDLEGEFDNDNYIEFEIEIKKIIISKEGLKIDFEPVNGYPKEVDKKEFKEHTSDNLDFLFAYTIE